MTAAGTRSSPRRSARPTSHEPDVSEVGERNLLGLTKAERYRILTQYRTIAMVGLSANYYNPSAFAAIYLDANGYDIVPVNPVRAGQEILGHPVYADLAAAAEGHPRPIEIVDVFRPADEAPAIAEQAVAIGAKVLWLQLGVISEPAAEIARAAGLDVVMDRCCKIEHARMFGGLRTIGLNTGLVTSRLAVRFPDEQRGGSRRFRRSPNRRHTGGARRRCDGSCSPCRWRAGGSTPTSSRRWFARGGRRPAAGAARSGRRAERTASRALDRAVAGPVELLVLASAVEADQAPREVVVDRRHRAAGHDQAEQAQRPVRGSVEQPLADPAAHPAVGHVALKLRREASRGRRAAPRSPGEAPRTPPVPSAQRRSLRPRGRRTRARAGCRARTRPAPARGGRHGRLRGSRTWASFRCGPEVRVAGKPAHRPPTASRSRRPHTVGVALDLVLARQLVGDRPGGRALRTTNRADLRLIVGLPDGGRQPRWSPALRRNGGDCGGLSRPAPPRRAAPPGASAGRARPGCPRGPRR